MVSAVTEPRLFRVDIDGYDTAWFRALTAAKARWRAFVAFREAFDSYMTFGAFLRRGVTVREANAAELLLFPNGEP